MKQYLSNTASPLNYASAEHHQCKTNTTVKLPSAKQRHRKQCLSKQSHAPKSIALPQTAPSKTGITVNYIPVKQYSDIRHNSSIRRSVLPNCTAEWNYYPIRSRSVQTVQYVFKTDAQKKTAPKDAAFILKYD